MAFRTNKTPVLQEKSASGSVATFNTALAMPLASCNIAVNAWQEGSGDPSPVNDRPIHGFSAVNATRAGKNLFDKTKYQTRKFIDDTTGEIIDIASNSAGVSDYIPVKAGEVLFIPSKGTLRNSLFDINKNLIRYFPVGSNKSVTIPNDGYIVLGGYNMDIDTFQVEVGSQATSFEPYVTPTIYPIQLGEEVYGAEVDVVNGVAHVNSELIIIDGSENITVQANYIKSDACDGYVNIKKGEALYLHDINGVMSNKLKLATTGFIWNTVGYPNTWKLYRHSTVTLGLHMNIENSLLGITDYTQETVDSVKTKMKNYLLQNNMQFVVELYNPFDIQLTPQQIETLIGNNTIFADTGDIDLTYKDLDIAKRGNFREVFRLPS